MLDASPRWVRGGSLVLGLACATLACAGAVRPLDDEAAPPAVQAAEALAPGLADPGYVEHMSAAIARDRAAKRAGRPKASAPFDRHGEWSVPSMGSAGTARSGRMYVMNKFGDTRMGVAFNGVVDLEDVWVLGQGGDGSWADAIRAVGYRDDAVVGATEWFDILQAEPARMRLELRAVDRVVFEARTSATYGAWFGIDDLAFAHDGARTVLDFEDLAFRHVLSGTDYAGLSWEFGSGELRQGDAISPPMVPPGLDLNQGAPEEEPELPMSVGGVLPPELLDDFAGVKRGDAGQASFPPDSNGAVGPNHVVCVVNENFAVYNKTTGAQLTNISLSSFQPGTSGDPRVLYDHHANRWVVLSTNFSTRIYVAYSLTDDPMGAWYKSNFIAATGSDSGTWVDHPTLGLDANGIYTCAYMVGGGNTMSCFAISKQNLLGSPPSLGSVQAFRNLPWEGAIQPCLTFGTPAGGEYLVSRNQSTQIRVRRITWNGTTASLTSVGFVSIPGASDPPDAAALGSNTNVDTTDWRLANALYRDGYIYTAHCIGISSRAAVRWYKIDVSSLVDTTGTIFDSTLSYYFPSIAANGLGDIVLGFSGSSASQYIGAYYTGKRLADATTATPVQYKAGQGPINLIDGFGRNRWGDYSLTLLDPFDDSVFWTIQAYARTGNNWGTWFAKLRYGEVVLPPSNDDCIDAASIFEGNTAFTTVNATTDGPDESTLCNFGGPTLIENDVWFRYVASCDGTATFATCGSSFDTTMALYIDVGTCPGIPNQGILACNDDFCVQGSTIVFPVVTDTAYLLRVGSNSGAEGDGVLAIQCVPNAVPCPPDLDDSGDVGFNDLLILLGEWGPCPGCASDLDGNGQTDFNDLLALLGAWGPCP